MSVLDHFERQAKSFPDFYAVRDRNQALTYLELAFRTEQIALALLHLGVQSEEIVGLYLTRSVDLISGILGIWKAGGAYLPLDPEFPSQRLAFMLDDCEVKFVLTERSLLTALEGMFEGKAICIEDVFEAAFQIKLPAESMISPHHLAYVIYTSGSTGRPKGVGLCHGALENNARESSKQLEISPSDVVLATATVAFDFSCLEFFPTLMKGACIYIVERASARDGMDLMRIMRESGATIVMGTPTLFSLLLETGWKGDPTIRVVVAGEPLPLSLGRILARSFRAVWNHYGPSETTVSVCVDKVEPEVDLITVGYPLANTYIYILNPSTLEPLPDGETGEVYIGGMCVGRGYIKRDELNKKSFLPDPFQPEPGARMYKSGDLGRRLPDGRIELLGRIDDQVKIRGFRIELKEIEESIREYEDVRGVTVQALEASSGDKRLIAFVKTAQRLNVEALKEHLRKMLPSYMVPSEFVTVEAIPINANGKVDRGALKALWAAAPSDSREVIAPRNETERLLKEVWERILKKSPISVTDDFFDLGGHSFLAARLFTEIERKLGRKVPLSVLAENSTIEKLARCIRQQEASRNWSGIVTLRESGRRPPLFIVYGLGGSLLTFRELADRLDRDQPVYGLQLTPGMVDQKEELTVSKVASIFIEQIKAVYPSGPYHIAGHSLGSFVAHEILAQLTQKGEEAGLLVVFDWDLYSPFASTPMVPQSRSSLSVWSAANLVLSRALSMMRRTSEADWRELVYRKYLYEKVKFQVRLLKRFADLGKLFPNQFGEDIYLARSTEYYVPCPYRGDAVVFMAADQLRSDPNFGSGWSKVVLGHCEVRKIPGTHQSIFSAPRVDVLARELEQRLQRANRLTQRNRIPPRTAS